MELDKYQQAAAETEQRRVLIAAVPGSGKTRTLCGRVMHLVEGGVRPVQIAMITFTRYAAREMQSRLDDEARSTWVGTFHSFALDIIQNYGSERGWEPSWLTILDEKEAEQEEVDALQDFALVNSRGIGKPAAIRAWREYRDAKINGEAIKPDNNSGLHASIFASFYNRLRAENVMTFGVMILEAIQILECVPGAAEAYHKRFQHILMDEAQDSDENQWRLLWLINPLNVYIVGDIDQAIYEWRGAKPELFMEFAKTATVYQLPYSYRFGVTLAEPANKLIKHNKMRLDVAIEAIGENKGTLHVENEIAASDVAELIRQELHDGTPLDDIAVLARTHRTLDDIAQQLAGKKIPHVKIGGKADIRSTYPYRVIRGYLRLAVNQRDKRAFMAIVNVERIENKDLWEMRRSAIDNKKTLVETYDKPLPATLEELPEYLAKRDPVTPYGDALRYVKRLRDFEGLSDLGDMVRYMSLEQGQDQLRDAEGKIPLCTIHAAKGLEWSTVFLVGMNAGQFPSPRSVKAGNMEEERRLCYVGMTRAEDNLFIVEGLPERKGDGPSSFLGELLDTPADI